MNKCYKDDETMKTSNKKGSNFLVLNKDKDSSDDKANMTISHEHIVAVQEDKKEENESDDGSKGLWRCMVPPGRYREHSVSTQSAEKHKSHMTVPRVQDLLYTNWMVLAVYLFHPLRVYSFLI